MNNTQTEGLKTYLIPDEKRNEYFDYVDMFRGKVKNITEENWNTYNDPLVTIDMSTFTFHQSLSIKFFMNRIGAKDVTESLLSKSN
jgi:hypothetical protein